MCYIYVLHRRVAHDYVPIAHDSSMYHDYVAHDYVPIAIGRDRCNRSLATDRDRYIVVSDYVLANRSRVT